MAGIEIYHRLYGLITEDDGDNCEEIPEEACSSVPRNFFLNAFNGAATKLADQLANPSLVLTWFLDALNVPASVIGFLSPVRQAGALLPQLIVSGQIRRFPIRKWFWLAGGGIFGLMLILMVPVSLITTGLVTGVAVVLLLAVGSMARGISSVAFKDVVAKTIPKGNRGILLALRATAGGSLALIAGLILRSQLANVQEIWPYLVLIGLGGLLWLIGVGLIPWVREEPGATEGSRNPLQEARAGVRLLKTNQTFRRYIVARSILLTVELSIPYFTLILRGLSTGTAGELGIFVVAASLADVLSSPVWGRMADRSSRQVLGLSGLVAVLAGLITLSFATIFGGRINPYVMVLPLMIVGFARAGIRLGRQTYLIDGAPGRERPTYVALSNTVIGILTIVGSGLGWIADAFGLQILIGLLTLAAFVGSMLAFRLPKSSTMRMSS
jgi:MFS family permease